jgi:hypothetical protein
MSRIRIDDLPPVETLTQEELDAIFGAGLRSFRPTFDVLEDRQLMAAGLTHSLLPNLPPPKGPLVSVVQGQGLPETNLQTTTHTASAVDRKDVDSLQKQTMDLFKKNAFEERGGLNVWGFKEITNCNSYISPENDVRVMLGVKYANILGSGTATLAWYYTFTKFDGNNKVFTLTRTSQVQYNDWDKDLLDRRMKSAIDNGVLRVDRPDAAPYSAEMRKAAEEVMQRLGARFNDHSVNGRHLVGKGEIVAVTDKGFTVKFRVQSNWMQWLGRDPGVESQVTAEVSLTFRYLGAANGFERFTCEDVKAGMTSVESRDRYNGNARYDHPTYDVGVVGLNEGGLKSDYRLIGTYGDGRTLETSVGAIVQQRWKDLNIHGRPDNWDDSVVGQFEWGGVEKIAGGYRVNFKVKIGVQDSGGNFIDSLGLGSYDFQLVVKDTGEVQCIGTNRLAKEFISAADAEKFQNNVAADLSAQMRGPATAGLQVDLNALAAAVRGYGSF